MRDIDHALVKQTFLEASDLEGTERELFLADLHTRQPDLGREVAALLDADSRGGVLSEPLLEPLDRPERVSNEPRPILPATLSQGLVEQIREGYDILELIGTGGMGQVFKAHHRLLDETRVIKVLRSEDFSGDPIRDRFLREARIASRLRHPGIARVLDYSATEAGEGFLVMEHIAGKTLAQLVEQRAGLPVAEVLWIADGLLEALDYLHRSGYLHRDISPDNLMLTRDETGVPRVVLIDLGIAAPIDRESITQLTQAGMFLGKLPFAAPERLLAGRQIDARSDLYSVGITLFFSLTGELPRVAEEPLALFDSLERDRDLHFPESGVGSEVPGEVRSWIRKSVARRAEDRFEDAATMRRELNSLETAQASDDLATEAWLVGEESLPSTTQVVTRPRPPGLEVRRTRTLMLLGGSLLITWVLLATGLLQRFDLLVYDRLFLTTPLRDPDARLVLVVIDEDSLSAIADPIALWSDRVGRGVSALFGAGAKGVAFDALLPASWSESSPFLDALLPHQDRVALAAYADEEGAVLGTEVLTGLASVALGPVKAREMFGWVNLQTDPDDRIRRVAPSHLDRKGRESPILANRIAQILDGTTLDEEIWIDYAIDWRRWRQVSFHELEALAEASPEAFRDRMVLFGGSFEGSGDLRHDVPHSRALPPRIPGVYLQALITQSILERGRLQTAPPAALILGVLGLGLLAFLPRSKSLAARLLDLCPIVAWLVIGIVALRLGWIVPVVTMIVAQSANLALSRSRLWRARSLP